MRGYPAIPTAEDAAEGLFASGHLWVTEKIDGERLRVQLRDSGLLRVGTETAVYDDPDAVPTRYRHAVRHVRERLDRGALRGALENVESVVLFGEATQKRTIEYDWERLPSFLGVDVWSADEERFRPPDAVERIYERLGLESVPVVEREVHTRDFDPGSYAVPESAYYDGPAEGVVVRNKAGGRAKIVGPAVGSDGDPEPDPPEASAGAVADRYVTERRLERLASALSDRGEAVTVEALYERALEDVFRERHATLSRGDGVEAGAFREALAARVRGFLDERRPGGE